MVGRGLRTIDPSIYPNIVKHDCIVLDFGISSILHGSLEQTVELNSGEVGFKICPSCQKRITKTIGTCPLCGADTQVRYAVREEILKGKERGILEYFGMREIDLLPDSTSFPWVELNGNTKITQGFNSWMSISKIDNQWVVRGELIKDGGACLPFKQVWLNNENEAIIMAERILHEFETDEATCKNAAWRVQPATEKQVRCLSRYGISGGNLTKGDASTLIAYYSRIEPKLSEYGVL